MAVKPAKLAVVTLFLYSAVFSFALAYGALSQGLAGGSLIPFALFFPVIYYFLREFFYQARVATAYRAEDGTFLTYFRLLPFLTQGNSLLYITLLLYLAALALIYLRYNNILSTSITF